MSTAPTKPLHIFAPGKHTTLAGEVIEFSLADIQATAAAFNPALSKAPIVIGHPATDDPAQGWAAGLSANERGLFASAEKLDPAFAEGVRAGRYGTVSSKFYRPTDPNNPVPGVWYLRHIGFLGAAAPGVKGLDDPAAAFAAAEDDGCVCFAEGVAFAGWEDMTNARMWRRMRDWFIGKFGQEEADAVLPSWDVSEIEQAAAREVSPPAFAERHPPPEESTVTEAEAAQLRASHAASEQRVAVLEAEKRASLTAAAHTANVSFAESLLTQGRLLPAWKDVAVATLDHLAAQAAPVEFGEGTAKAPLIDGLRAMLEKLPVQVEFAETATRERAAVANGGGGDPVEFASADPDRLAQHRAIEAHMAAHKVDYATAARAVISK